MKPWLCSVCGKDFKSYGNVYQHKRSHSVFRPYICRKDPCHLSFSSLSEYQTHRRRHVNRRPYECRLCGKTFVHRNHQHLHRCRRVRSKLYYCHVCPQTFREILSLAYHVRKSHSKAICMRKKHCHKPLASKKSRVQEVNVKKADSKILLKITAGKSMTIISPLKTSASSHGKRKKDKVKKSKRKQKEDSQKSSIILSIKKGSVKMSSETKLKPSKQDSLKRFNGLVNRVVESCDRGSNLKMKIKTFPDKSASPLSNETLNRYSYPSSPSSFRKIKKVTTKYNSDTEHKVASVVNDSVVEESRVRNGIVIVKDKSGKFLAEQLQSAKAKKRDNVFDSFSDAGLWKVLPSPRHDSSLDYLKLRLSPQKPLRLDSGIDLPCDKARYLDVGASVKSGKVENYSEDSDVFEASPGVDKDSDPGLQNVNDSGIEILSSSSCNRSNGNSVRSVLLDDNSPTYFPTEDSLLSLDSPVTDIQPKTEHTICPKCGGIYMETNNNTQSPRKCHCNSSLVNSPSQAPSPVKLPTHIASQDNRTTSSADTNLQNVTSKKCDNRFEVNNEKCKDINETDDSDIILQDDCDEVNQTEKVSEYDDVEIIRDIGYSNNRSQSDLKLRLKLKPRKTQVSKKAVKGSSIKDESIVYTEMKEGNVSEKSEKETVNVKPKCEKNEAYSNLQQSEQTFGYGASSVSGSDILPELLKHDGHLICHKANNIQSLTINKLTTETEPCRLEVKQEEISDFRKSHKSSTIQSMTEEINISTEHCLKEVKDGFNNDYAIGLKASDIQPSIEKELTIGPYREELKKRPNENENSPKSCGIKLLTEKEMIPTDSCKKEMDKKCTSDNEHFHVSSDAQLLNEKELIKTEPCKKEVKKKPLFKSKNKKQSVISDSMKIDNVIDQVVNDSVDTDPKLLPADTEQINHVRKKKPIFKKRSSSGDSTSEPSNKINIALKLEIPDRVCDADSVSKDRQKGEVEDDSDKIIVPPEVKSELKKSLLSDKESMENTDKQDSQIPEPLVSVLGVEVNNSKPQVEDNDSLLQIPSIENKEQTTKPSSKKSCTSPLDLFQQQFLSFLSSNKPLTSEEKSKERSADEKNKEGKSKVIQTTDKDLIKAKSECEMQIESDVNVSAGVGEDKLSNISFVMESSSLKNKSISDKRKDLTSDKKKEKLSLKKPKSEAKEGEKTLSKAPVESKQCSKKGQLKKKDSVIEKYEKEKSSSGKNKILGTKCVKNGEQLDMAVEESGKQKQEVISFGLCNKSDKKSNSDHSHLETRTDSLSWLKIFSESIENKSTANKDNKNSSEEITDFSADLAAINKKMDVSDDELNNLDVDHLFKSTNLATLQPIALGDRNTKRHKAQVKRPQKAKRSVGPLNHVKRILESDSEFSDSSSHSGTIGMEANSVLDADFNPFHDSDGDFDMVSLNPKQKRRKKSIHKHPFDDFDSDSDNGLTGLKTQADQEKVQSSRTKRLKQGRKSCCPCCLGSPVKASREYHSHHKYRLPKNSKQFVKSSMKLLELQAKIHQLFLSLFPDCAEIISNSKVGTEEFEMLIDEVLGSLEDRDISFEASTMDPSHGYIEGLYSCENQLFCNTHSMHVHNTDRSNEILQTESTFHECCKASSCSMSKESGCCTESECTGCKVSLEPPFTDNRHPVEHVKDPHTLNSAIESDILSTITSHSGNKGALHPLSASPSVTCEHEPQTPSGSFQPNLPTEAPWNDIESMSCEDASEFGMLDSDITITIDLNAAKVSLCRDPKNCLEKLHNRIARLVQCLLPKLKLKKTFFRNIDNLHFLLDLLIAANLPGSYSSLPLSDEEIDNKVKGSSSTAKDDCKIKQTEITDVNVSDRLSSTNMSYKSVNQAKPKDETKTNKDNCTSYVERVPLLSKFQDMFEQEIKSHRESLKRDVFEFHPSSENVDQGSLQKAKEVLTAIKKIEKLNKAKQKLRPRRDPRLRKRNEAESRKLFVQEKILNSQNSTIVCHSSPKKSTKFVRKSRKKNKDSKDSKESFLSRLDLGGNTQEQTQSDNDTMTSTQDGVKELTDINEVTDTKNVTEERKSETEDLKDSVCEIDKNITEDTKIDIEDGKSTTENSKSTTEDEKKETESTEFNHDLTTVHEENEDDPEKGDGSLVHENSDSQQKSGEKNIFELMQPS